MCDEAITIETPLTTFPDEQLAGLFVATTLWHPHAEAFAICIAKAIHLEGQRRQHNRTHPASRQEAGYFVINFALWSDKDVADALLLTTVFTYQIEHPQFGEFIDEVAKVIAQVATMRLCGSSDPRNALSFEQRYKEGSRYDPEAN